MRHIALATAALLVSFAFGISAQAPSALVDDISALNKEITAAETESAALAGGLVKALIESRAATLRQTRAMLDQKRKAVNHSIALKYTIDGKPFTLPPTVQQDLAAVEAELVAVEAQIVKQESEAAKYSGGLVYAMALTTVATSRQSQAMLNQKRLALKYGLPQYVAFLAGPSSAGTTSAAATVAPSTASTEKSKIVLDELEIASVDARVTERNDTWWKNAWKVTVKNNGTETRYVRVTMEFYDKDGFIIDTDDGDGVLSVPAQSESTATGYALITAGIAGNVAKIGGKIRLAR